jgi:hypothetical protein
MGLRICEKICREIQFGETEDFWRAGLEGRRYT